jgi:hypothetical protein
MIGVTRALSRCVTSSRSFSRGQTKVAFQWNGLLILMGTAATATATASTVVEGRTEPRRFRVGLWPVVAMANTNCEAAVVEDTTTTTNHDNEQVEAIDEEEELFLDTLAMYRRWLKEIKKQWAISSPESMKWPRNIPQKIDISALETDLKGFYKGNEESTRKCQDLEFRIASYYLFREESVEQQKKGFHIIKKLAVNGHLDGLCLYGKYKQWCRVPLNFYLLSKLCPLLCAQL